MTRSLERWVLVGDGLILKEVVINVPLTVEEALKLSRSEHVVITIFDAITNEFLGMAYASVDWHELEMVRYGRRYTDPNPFT